MDDTLCGDGNGECQSDCPQVEGQIVVLRQPFRNLRQQMPENSGEKEGTEEQGEYPTDDAQEGTEEGQFGIRMDERNEYGHEYGCRKVDNDGVGRECANITAQFPGDDGCGSGGGAYHTDDESLDDDGPMSLGGKEQQKGSECECAALQQQGPTLPGGQAQVAGLNLTEGKEQHGEDEGRLNECDGTVGSSVCVVQCGNGPIDEITCCSNNHGYRECPVF